VAVNKNSIKQTAGNAHVTDHSIHCQVHIHFKNLYTPDDTSSDAQHVVGFR